MLQVDGFGRLMRNGRLPARQVCLFKYARKQLLDLVLYSGYTNILWWVRGKMPVDIAVFHNLLNRFQDAALEPSRWPSLLEQIAEATGAGGINVMAPASSGSVGGVLFTESLSSIMEAYINDGWNTRDHRAKFIPLMKRNGVVLEEDFVRKGDLDNLEYYKFMAKHGFQHTAVVNFSSGEDDLFFVLQRRLGDGGFGNDDRVHLATLRTHLQMSARIMALFSAGDMRGRLAAFERADVACVFFDHRGHVVAANEKADSLLTGDVRIAHGKIRAASSRETVVFETMLNKVIRSNDLAHGEVVTLTRGEKRPLLARIERAGPNLRDVFARSYAMVLFEDVSDKRFISYDVLHHLFGLTPSECKIAALLADGADLRTVAGHCGIQYETVRTHIRSILRKTGTDRQAELCVLLAGIRLG